MSNEEVKETWQRFWRQNKDKEVSLDGMDGMDGMVTALTKAGGSFFKYAKLLELQRKSK